jgi:hypothetical protein
MKKVIAGIAVAIFALAVVAPTFATATIPTNADLVVTCGVSASPCYENLIPVGGVATFNFCMSNGVTGVIWNTASGLGTSGLEVKSPGGVSSGDPTGAVTAWTYTPAAFQVIPACGSGEYSVQFGQGTSGWVKLSGPTVAQTSESGSYTIDVDYKQGTTVQTLHAFFDVKVTVPTPEFSMPLVAVAATSLVGLALLRKKFVKVPA